VTSSIFVAQRKTEANPWAHTFLTFREGGNGGGPEELALAKGKRQPASSFTRRVAQTIKSKTILGAEYAVFACAGLESNSCATQVRPGGRLTHLPTLPT